MSANAPYRAGAVGGRVRAAPPAHALSASEAAWLAVLPCALVLIAAALVLGPPLGRALLAPPAVSDIWSHYLASDGVRPEPTEHARYAIALLGPLLLGAAAVACSRSLALRPAVAAAAVTASQALLAAFVIVCVVAQRRIAYGSEGAQHAYFTPATLVVAGVVALLLLLLLRQRPLLERLARVAGEGTAKHVGALAAATAFTLVWLLTAFNTEGTIGAANVAVAVNVPFWLDESFAVLNGHAPLVDFHAQYGQLWAYLAAGALSVFGTTFGVYAVVMLTGTTAALLAVFETLRRVCRSALVALALFLPFVATSFFMKGGPPDNRYSPANLFSLFPIRYAGPFLLLWLTVRQLERGPPRQPLLLFAVAGLVAVNNVEFGIPALGATLAALAWADPPRSRSQLLRLGAGAAGGLLCAVAIVSLLTLAVAGSLPHFELLATFPRIFGVEGFGMMPLEPLGLHLVVYVTLAAALVVATVRAASSEDDAGLIGALAWAGVFGLGAGSYFVGRSHPDVLTDLFAAWALALSLLTVVAVRAIARRPSRRPAIAELLVLFGFGVAVCSVAQTPTPWSQLERLGQPTPTPTFRPAQLERLVDRLTRPGEPIALLTKVGHRIAYDVGVDNVAPYANLESMLTKTQWRETIDALRAAGGHTVIVPAERFLGGQVALLQREAFELSGEFPELGVIQFDGR